MTRLVKEAENRLERFNSERERIIATVQRRVLDQLQSAAAELPECSLEYVLNEVAFAEIRRYEKARGKDAHKKLSRWRELALRLGRMPEHAKRAELEKIVGFHAADIAGNFNPRVYRFANDVLPPALSFLLAPISSVRDGLSALGDMAGQVEVAGEIDLARLAAERGTLVFAPTHSSNLDSIVLGFGLSRSKLPPVTYGAGKNLFGNPLTSFFMHNLGAYRVDRRLKFGLYKDVLKEYSTVLLERGYHSLFFPGGTRCRSGHVEHKLKLGLLGTALAAYQNTLLEGSSTRRIYVVPVTINYRLVLEAETLIEDYLEETGQSRYIIEDDEFSRLGRVVEFVRKLLTHGGSVTIRLGRPLDVFGNLTDGEGDSLDPRGRVVDPASYLRGADGSIARDRQRDAVYTRRLGKSLAAAYQANTVLLSTHLVCRAMFDAIRERTRITDIYQLLRLPPSAVAVDAGDATRRIEGLRAYLRAHPEHGREASSLSGKSGAEILEDGLRSLGTYHTRPVAVRSGDSLRVGYFKLLYYYQNRTAHIATKELAR
jgi:glycerol-3-phosphate O-acyltransferase